MPIALVLGFVLFKIRDLLLPYFWDEAWSYIPAILQMAEHGPSLFPNAISPELYRGHPLLFYFLSSLWFKYLGTELWLAKLFPLIISICFLLSVFSLAKKHVNYNTALISLLLLVIQSLFFAQATFFLPEILLGLFTIQSISSYLDKKYTLNIFWLTLALFTKESAIVIWGTISLFRFYRVLNEKGISNYSRFKSTIVFLLPLVFIFSFFLFQKITLGWLFFPEHLSYFGIDEFFNRLNGYSSYLFIYMGRNLITLFGLIAFLILLFKKANELKEKREVLFLFLFFIIAYLIFSSLNFYSPRYLISILPFTIIIWTYLLVSVLQKRSVFIGVIVFGIIITNNLSFTLNKREGNDHTLGYRDLIHVQTKMISYCENLNLYDTEIYTSFLMTHNLKNYDLGYLNNSATFKNATSDFTDKTEYAIFSSSELDNDIYETSQNKGLLIKRFEEKKCWIELYQIEKSNQ